MDRPQACQDVGVVEEFAVIINFTCRQPHQNDVEHFVEHRPRLVGVVVDELPCRAAAQTKLEPTATELVERTRERVCEFFHAPRKEGEREHVLEPNEMVLSVSIPGKKGLRSANYEVAQKRSYDWPMAQAVVAFHLDGKMAKDVRIILGECHRGHCRDHRSEDRSSEIAQLKESRSHHRSLDAQHRAAKQRCVKEL